MGSLFFLRVIRTTPQVNLFKCWNPFRPIAYFWHVVIHYPLDIPSLGVLILNEGWIFRLIVVFHLVWIGSVPVDWLSTLYKSSREGGLMGYSHWLSLGPEQGQGPRPMFCRNHSHWLCLGPGLDIPCPCSGPCSCSCAVWKVLLKTIQPIVPDSGPNPGDSQCEYTIMIIVPVFELCGL